MKFELTFNKEIYNKQLQLLFDLTLGKKIIYYKNSQYLGLFLLTIGIVLILIYPNKLGVGYLFVVFVVFNIVPFIYYYFKLKSFKNARVQAVAQLSSFENINWEFTESSLVENYDKFSKVVSWEEFVYWVVKEGTLIMITRDFYPYILSEAEIGIESFQEIRSFVKTKIINKEHVNFS
ncbi:hypothetical protein [Flavobacterium mesophilum]|uniref:hypothetical protein n=1 Tax=Flavobacterium mesophilum TaxID=3143495 RepID=UPI0031E2E53D